MTNVPTAQTTPDPVLALVLAARTNFAAFVSAVHRPRFHHSYFSLETCRAVDQFVEDVIAGKRPVLDLTAPPQHGKLMAHSTPVLTANRGWTTHGDLVVGDRLYRPDGSTTTTVVALSPDAPCDAQVQFSDGTTLLTHSNHEWKVHRAWLNGRTARVMETKEIAAVGLWQGEPGKRGCRAKFQLPHVAPLQNDPVDLPLHPYVLGVWLGDGVRTKPVITAHPNDRAMLDAVAACGYPQTNEFTHKTTGVLSAVFDSIRQPLLDMGLLNLAYRTQGGGRPKFIPDLYYRASIEQRLQLLAGLVDSDGAVYAKNGRITFSTCEPELAESVAKLVATFGWRVTTVWLPPALSSSGIQGRQPVAQVCWQNTLHIPCRLPRKRDAQRLDRMVRKRAITNITFGEFETGRCIQVAHPDGMYLVGPSLIPTHNSSLTSRCLPGYLIGRLGPILGQCRIALSSYALARAKANARDAKAIMLEPIYREIFPHASLIGFKGVSTADEIHHPYGFIKAQGAGGSLTGFSIDCFAPDTLVATDRGPVRIDQLYLHAKTCKVLSYDGQDLFYAGIKAIAHRQATRLYWITTDAGRVLKVTGNHPIYSAGAWRPASELATGDVLLCAVQSTQDVDSRRIPETQGAEPVVEAEQLVVQFTDLVSAVSHAPPSRATDARTEVDRIRSVEILDGPVRVFDVQVQAHACLFAGGILAHNCAINDDLTKDAQEALSQTVQDGLEDWYDSVLSTRLQERSGQVNIGTPWSANDIMARIHKKHKDNPSYRRLSFVALNLPDQIGYNPDQPEGPLVPKLHSLDKLQEIMRTLSEMWWAAMFQQAPLSEVGAIFKKEGVRYYKRADLPKQFIQKVISVDATFKDNKGSDYVFAGVWGKTADERVWLLDFRREKLSFTKTAEAIVGLKASHAGVSKIFIEDAANGPALIDMLSKHITGIVPVPPLGSKEARAHAVSWVWANGSVMLPDPTEVPSIVPVVSEITAFPDVRNDDAVDGMTIALHQLCLRNPISSMITADILRMAGRPA